MTAPADILASVRGISGGTVTQVYPSLAAADPEALAVALHPRAAPPTAAGDVDRRFILMSVAKPFVLALAIDRHGPDAVLRSTGMRDTGRAFNDPRAIADDPAGLTNPMVNPGAITASSLLADADGGERALRDGLAAFAGGSLDADPAMVATIHATNSRNRELATLLERRGLLATGVETALHLYTLQSCLAVTAPTLARMGAVLAHDGRDPVTARRVVGPEAAAIAIDAMALAGLYEGTSAWMARVGVPAKSGIAGGMVAVAPGRGAIAAYSAPLDAHGNPLRAQAAIEAAAATLSGR